MYRYDVAVSFAGEDREIVERFVRILLDNRVGVFYDAIQEDSLWGKDLYQYLDTIYREAARYCVIFVSKHYAGKRWPEHELTSAQARAFQQNSEYILPSMTRACGCFLRLAARFHRPATATTDERTSTLTGQMWVKDAEGKQKARKGRLTDILIKEGGKWPVYRMARRIDIKRIGQ